MSLIQDTIALATMVSTVLASIGAAALIVREGGFRTRRHELEEEKLKLEVACLRKSLGLSWSPENGASQPIEVGDSSGPRPKASAVSIFAYSVLIVVLACLWLFATFGVVLSFLSDKPDIGLRVFGLGFSTLFGAMFYVIWKRLALARGATPV